MDIDMFYVNLNEMHSVQFWPSGNCSDNHVQKLVSTIHHDMFPCFLLDWKARPDVWTWAKDNPPWEDVPINERGHKTQVGLLPFLTRFLEAFDGWIAIGCSEGNHIGFCERHPSHTGELHPHIYMSTLELLASLFTYLGATLQFPSIHIKSHFKKPWRSLHFRSLWWFMMSIPPSGFSPPHFAWCRGEDRWVQAVFFFGCGVYIYILPIGGLYATYQYHLLGEPDTTIEVIFWTMGIHYPCPLSACIHLPAKNQCLSTSRAFLPELWHRIQKL